MTASAPHRYLRMWARVPQELGFLLPLLPIVVTALSVLATVFFTGIGMIAIVVGFVVILAALFAARGFGVFEVLRLRASGFPRITLPAWDRVARREGAIAKMFAPFIDGHYWLYLLHGMIVNPIVGIVSWSIAVAWTSTALGGVSYWFWGRFTDDGDQDFFLSSTVLGWLTRSEVPRSHALESVFLLVVGLLFLVTLPFVTRGLTAVHHGIARGMLGVFRSEGLAVEVAGLSASRSAAVSAEGTALRRLERDIHDGPQQRLVRLQMDLAAADRQLDADPEKARALLAEALQQSRDALEELRAVSRGFAPPLLLDRGLLAALEALAARSAVPVRFHAQVPEGVALPVELERNAYFIAAEGLTNVAKHAEASDVELFVGLRRVPGSDESWLDVAISDNGRGGATAVAGHGIAGLEERVRGFGGLLDVTSPVGGPTVVAAHLPVFPPIG